MNNIKKILQESRTIKQFEKKGSMLVHPFAPNGMNKKDDFLNVYLYTLGHLWLYTIFEENGYGNYLKEIIEYSMENKNALFEWEIEKETEIMISEILKKYDIEFQRFIVPGFKLVEYRDIDEKSKDKDLPLMRLTRLLVMAELGMAEQFYDKSKDIKVIIDDEGTIINATYLLVTLTKGEEKIFDRVPESFIDILMENMNCYYDKSEMKYYPKINELMKSLCLYEQLFEENWYWLSDNQQVIISKFLYSVQIMKELSVSLLGLNGILSGVSTRILFDNYWQSLYLIKNNKIENYRDFVHKRMRLHILKRADGTDTNIGELLRAVEDGYFDPIPVNGDYFTKSAREYAIELGIKDDYDKYYEFNSEFIHASLTAVYSGIMVPCKNPEHNGHLMVKNGGARMMDSVPGLFYLLDKHIDLVNSYLGQDVIPKMEMGLFFQNRNEWINSSTDYTK